MKLKARWDGKSFTTKEKVDLAIGENVTIDVKRARSNRQHGFFFVAIEKAFDTWPESHPFQPTDSTQLRYWLEIQAGWGHTVHIPSANALIIYLKDHWRDHMWAEQIDDGFLVHIAKSIAYDRMEKGDFQKLVTRVDDVLYKELGVGLRELKLNALEDVQ